MRDTYPGSNLEIIEKALYCNEHGDTESCENWLNHLRDRLASAAPAEVDNWQQYAKEGETAQQCIERHRAEQDALLKLYGRAAHAEGREPTGDELRKLVREIRDASGGPSDAPQPADYVLGGWRAAIAIAPTKPAEGRPALDERAPINHKLHVPPRGDEEPTALLVYGEDRFEIGYTLMHWLAGVLAMGARHSGVGDQILLNARAAFDFIDAAMCWDENPPEQEGEHADFLRRVGYSLKRPQFSLPYPEVTKYEDGHTPRPFKHRAALATAPTMSEAARDVLWRHKKTGGVYSFVAESRMERDPKAVVVTYRNINTGETWTRPYGEFYDGRFERIDRAAAKGEPT